MNNRRGLVYLPENKEFWCRGHQFNFVLGQVMFAYKLIVHSQ